MHRIILIISLVLTPCAVRADQPVFVSLARASQIATYHLRAETGTLIAKNRIETPGQPGSMCVDSEGKHLYVAMKKTGALAAFRIERDGDQVKLVQHGEVATVGADPSYVAVDPSGKFLLSAYYAAGQVTVHRIKKDGSLSSEAVMILKTDERAHAVVFDQSGKFVFVPHTRPNAISQFSFDNQTGKLSPNKPLKLSREDRSGPRHLWFHPNGQFAYGSDEQGSSVTRYRFDQQTGQLKTQQTVSSLPAGFDGKNSTSDIEVHPNGKFLYIANRGHNTIAGYAIDSATGKLTLLQHTPTEAVTRSFNIAPDGRHLIAAGQSSGKLAVFSIGADGKLTRTSTVVVGETPWWVHILALPIVQDTAAAQQQKSRVAGRVKTEANGDIVLIHELIVNVPVAKAWKAYSTTEGWKGWVTPNAEVDLRVGGVIRTNYRKSGKLTDDDAITLHIINYVPERVLTLQAELAPHFPEVLKKHEKHLFNVVTFQQLPNDQTKIVSYGTGYRDSPELQKMLKFFLKANESSLLELVRYLETGQAKPHQTK